MGAVARRLGEGDLERRRLRRAVALLPARLVMHQQAKAAHERMLRRQPGDQPRQQHRRAVQHLLAAVGAGEQLEAALEQARRDDRLARIGAAAEGGVDLGQQRLRRSGAPGRRAAGRAGRRCCAGPFPAAPPSARGRGRAARPAQRRAPRRVAADRGSAAAARRGPAPPRPARSRRWRCAARGRAARVACCRRCSEAIEAAEVAQARLHFEQHRVRPPRPARSAGCSETCGVKASAAWATGSIASASRAGSAWPSVMRGASASAVARFSPGLTPCACAAALAAEMRCSSTRAIADRRRLAAAPPTKVAANDSSESKGRCSAIQSTMNPGRERRARTRATANARERHGGERSGEIDEGRRRAARAARSLALLRAPPRRRPTAPPAARAAAALRAAARAASGRAAAAGRRRPPAGQAQRRRRRPAAAAASRSTKAAPSWLWAASWRRRSRSARRRGGSQATTAPTWPLFSACSSAHRLSLPGTTRARVLTTSSSSTSKPRPASAAADSAAGGSKTITSRPARCAATSAGASRRISPTPACGSSSSLSTRRGQPPPGSSASRRGEAARARRALPLRPSWWPSQSAGCRVSGARRRIVAPRAGAPQAARRSGAANAAPAPGAHGGRGGARRGRHGVHVITVRLYSIDARPADPDLARRAVDSIASRQLIDCFRQLSGPESAHGNAPPDSRTEAVRRFNRFYTRRIGVLHEKLADDPLLADRIAPALGARPPRPHHRRRAGARPRSRPRLPEPPAARA